MDRLLSRPYCSDTDESREVFAKYWGIRITAWNPDQNRQPDLRHPSSLPFSEITNTTDTFTALINRFQVHRDCRKGYCLRPKSKKKSKRAIVSSQTRNSVAPGQGVRLTATELVELLCRFYFPRPETLLPCVTKEINHKSYIFAPARNQAKLAQCAPIVDGQYGYSASYKLELHYR
jgi:hypothetical protein